MCRHAQVGPPTPDVEMRRVVNNLPRDRPCGTLISDVEWSDHEKACGICTSTLHRVDELIEMVMVLTKQSVHLDNGRKTALRDAKRAREETAHYREESERITKKMRNIELRAHRHMARETTTAVCGCNDCVAWRQ